MTSPILQPVVALALWTFVMWAWMYATRIPAVQASGAPMNPEATAAEFNAAIPPRVRWKADNYNHLHEAPTVFYAIAIVLAIVGEGDGLNAWLGWAYVALRVIHSLVQATVNKLIVRFALFALSSLVLIALVVHAALAVL